MYNLISILPTIIAHTFICETRVSNKRNDADGEKWGEAETDRENDKKWVGKRDFVCSTSVVAASAIRFILNTYLFAREPIR